LGVALLLVGVYMAGHTPQVLDCNRLRSACPRDFGALLDKLGGVPGGHLTKEAAVNSYCNCVDECINYMLVYTEEGATPEPERTNCFLKSQAAGVGSSRAAPTNGTARPPEGSLPTLTGHTCVTCASASEAQEGTYVSIASLSSVCGVLLIATAGCEIFDISFRSVLLSAFTLGADAAVGCLLLVATFISVWGLVSANLACDADPLRRTLEQAGRDSTDGDANRAAIYANFLIELLEPMAAGVCAQLHEFSVYASTSVVAGAASFWSFCATLWICAGLSDDSDDTEDEESGSEARKLMAVGASRRRG